MMWGWLILAGVLLAVEMTSGTLALLFAGLGALAAALLAWFLPEQGNLQIAVFAVASVAGVIVAWRRRGASKNQLEPDDGTSAVARKVVVVTPPDASGHLRVRYRGSDWPAALAEHSAIPAAGDTLTVVRQEGSVLVVQAPEH
jgi:membrane protein implicated in regulation of membrane protease activity